MAEKWKRSKIIDAGAVHMAVAGIINRAAESNKKRTEKRGHLAQKRGQKRSRFICLKSRKKALQSELFVV